MIDQDRPHEIGYLWGDQYASRQDIGAINYVSQCEPRWSRLQRDKQRVEYKIEDVRGEEGKVAARHRHQLREDHWQLELDCERAIVGDGAFMVRNLDPTPRREATANIVTTTIGAI